MDYLHVVCFIGLDEKKTFTRSIKVSLLRFYYKRRESIRDFMRNLSFLSEGKVEKYPLKVRGTA